MTESQIALKAGTRPSKLALTQSKHALDQLEAQHPGVRFEQVSIASVGDSDRTTDLRESPLDFFTRELDEALLRGDIDFAIHSAKDLPDVLPTGISAYWLPWREEPRDVLVYASGRTATDLPENPIIGISSARRAEYAQARFPDGRQQTIRGNIEERIAQLDRGEFDVVIIAAAALIRLGIENRISEWIPLAELPVPDGQGYLAITYRSDDQRIAKFAPLYQRHILLTCSEALQEKATTWVRTFGGLPLPFPLIQLHPRADVLHTLTTYDWVVITSPSAARCFMQQVPPGTPLPKLMVCGKGTANELATFGAKATASPTGTFNAEAVVELGKIFFQSTDRVLRLRADRAGPHLAEALRQTGAMVDDLIFYDNLPVPHDILPAFDAIFFASSSGAENFIKQWSIEALHKKTVCVIGQPTAKILEKYQRPPNLIADEATVYGAIHSLALYFSSM